MTKEQIRVALDRAIEALSAAEHERWAHWQSYLHSKCTRETDGVLLVPADLVSKWEKQISTSYVDLTEAEKESDREQVRRYLPIIVDALVSSLAMKQN